MSISKVNSNTQSFGILMPMAIQAAPKICEKAPVAIIQRVQAVQQPVWVKCSNAVKSFIRKGDFSPINPKPFYPKEAVVENTSVKVVNPKTKKIFKNLNTSRVVKNNGRQNADKKPLVQVLKSFFRRTQTLQPKVEA